MTHLPKNKYCPYCRWAKAIAKHARKRKHRREEDLPKLFGQLVAGDHWLSKDGRSLGLNGEKFALLLYDIGTKFIYCDPQGSKDTEWNMKAFNDFAGTEPGKKILQFYSDNAKELCAAANLLGIVHPTSIPYVSTTNALAERRIRIVKEGTRVSLSTSGVPTSLWPFAAKHFCMSLNIGMIEDTDTLWISRFGSAFPGRRIPFGQYVKYKPRKSYQLAVHGERMIDGIFLCWDLAPGCVGQDCI